MDRVQEDKEATRRNSGSFMPVTEEKDDDDHKKPFFIRNLLEQNGFSSSEKRRSSLRSVSLYDSSLVIVPNVEVPIQRENHLLQRL